MREDFEQRGRSLISSDDEGSIEGSEESKRFTMRSLGVLASVENGLSLQTASKPHLDSRKSKWLNGQSVLVD